ncbi:NADP-dependent oxidoreductase [Lacticaseibacillus camelliae]|nr:NADP-dependent oxidoreductase [Lacticaseibacillus camelliae]
MQAFGFELKHGATVLSARTLPDLTPAADEVIIDVQAVGLNNRERMARRGAVPGDFNVLGSDVAGTVTALGRSVADITIGERVLVRTTHGDATQVRAPARDVVVLPRALSFEQAAGMITPGITAYRAVAVFTRLQPGHTVVIKGASGGVGLLVVQLAKARDVHVIGVASGNHRNQVLTAGADEFFAYDTENHVAALDGRADIVFNVALNGINGQDDVAMVRPGGQIISVAHREPYSDKPVQFTHIHPLAVPNDHTILTELVPLFADGLLKLPIGTLFPFTAAGFAAAHDLLPSPHEGRIVVSAADD